MQFKQQESFTFFFNCILARGGIAEDQNRLRGPFLEESPCSRIFCTLDADERPCPGLGQLQLSGSSPRGVKAAGRIRVRVAVLLSTGRPDGAGGGRARLATLDRPLRPADLALQQRGGRLAGRLLLILRRAEVLWPLAPAFSDGRVLRRRHQLVVQLGMREASQREGDRLDRAIEADVAIASGFASFGRATKESLDSVTDKQRMCARGKEGRGGRCPRSNGQRFA